MTSYPNQSLPHQWRRHSNSQMNNNYECAQGTATIVFQVLFGILTAFNCCLSLGFILIQVRDKGSGAFTRFSFFATILPLGVAITTISAILLAPQKLCGMELSEDALLATGFGVTIVNIAYLCFVFLRSQPLLLGWKKRAMLVLFVVENILFIFAIIKVDPPIFLSIMRGLIGVLALITDISFFIVFSNHLRYMNLKLDKWLVLTNDDDALRVLAKTGIRCSLTVLSAAIFNIISLVFDQYNMSVWYEIGYFIAMALLSALGVHIMVMKHKVDQAQLKTTSTQGMSELGSAIRSEETKINKV